MNTLMLIPKKQTLFTLVILGAMLLSVSCKKDKESDPNPLKRVTVQLNGATEVPAVSTTGTGTANIAFDPVAKTIAYTINWHLGSDTSTTTGMHFHGAADGSATKSSPVVIPVTGFTNASSGTLSGVTVALTQEQVDQLLAGKWYFNIHSALYRNGEIRGNIIFPATSGTGTGTGNGNGGYDY